MARYPLARYAVAVSVVGLVALIKVLIEVGHGPGPPLVFFAPAVTVAAWYGGLGPGLLALALSALVCTFFYFAPVGSLMIQRTNDVIRLFLFLFNGMIMCVLMEQLRSARRQSEASAAEAQRYRDTLRESEERLQIMMDNSPALIYLKDAEGRYLLANRHHEDLLGISGPQLVGKTDRDLFPRDLADRFQAHDREVLESGRALEWEDEILHTDGLRTYLTIKFPVRDASGTPCAVGGFSTDITGRKRAVLALRASEERFRSLSACSPLGVFLTDVDGKSTYTNPRCQEIFGMAFEDALGDGWTRYVHPDDRDRVVEHWAAATRHGRALAPLEYRTLNPRGESRWVLDQAAPVVSDRGELVGYVGTVEDITERRRAEEEVHRERDFAERLIETAQAFVLVLDGRGRIVRSNSFLERATGCRRDQLRGANWFATFVPDRDRPAARAAFERALGGAEDCHVTHAIVIADGREREVEWANRALAGVVGDTPGVLAIGHDLTALRQAQQRALQAERLAAIGQMMTGLAHESRNALQRGQACLEMLVLRLKGRPEVLEQLHLEDRPAVLDLLAGIQDAQDDLHHLYEEVRGYAAPLRLERRAIPLGDVLHEAWARLGAERDGRQVRLRERGTPAPTCAGDRFRLVQVFRNILDNALAACHDPVEIVVEWSEAALEAQPAVRVTVRDNGPGLSTEQRENLFEPFYSTKAHGTGLGMAITRRIIEAHGGRISAVIVTDGDGDGDAEAGQGATIQILLPRGSS